MISKCANPECSARFQYLREGRLFRMEAVPDRAAGEPAPYSAKVIRHVEHYWLCGMCSRSLTLVLDNGQVVAVPVKIQAAAS
jgi:hypothetical protein